VTGPPSPCDEACSFMMAETVSVTVCSKVWRASEGAFATYGCD
jgi:hypothetical protein